MKKQSHKDRMDESMSMRNGKESTKKQSMASRRHEAEGAKKAYSKMSMKSGCKMGMKAKEGMHKK